MNTYFKSTCKITSHEFFAIRDAKTYQPNTGRRVKATAKLRGMAKLGAIPTYRVLDTGKLGLL
jgi:hypothetical protein